MDCCRSYVKGIVSGFGWKITFVHKVYGQALSGLVELHQGQISQRLKTITGHLSISPANFVKNNL